jgi:hypothetical protein
VDIEHRLATGFVGKPDDDLAIEPTRPQQLGWPAIARGESFLDGLYKPLGPAGAVQSEHYALPIRVRFGGSGRWVLLGQADGVCQGDDCPSPTRIRSLESSYAGEAYELTFATPTTPEGLRLRAEVDWAAGGGRYRVGVTVLAFDDPASAGVEFQTMNTVLAPYTFDAGNNFSQSISGTPGHINAMATSMKRSGPWPRLSRVAVAALAIGPKRSSPTSSSSWWSPTRSRPRPPRSPTSSARSARAEDGGDAATPVWHRTSHGPARNGLTAGGIGPVSPAQ